MLKNVAACSSINDVMLYFLSSRRGVNDDEGATILSNEALEMTDFSDERNV